MAPGRWDLPDDLAADVLRRLPPRSLAVCRCACRAWRDLVDGRRLLRADLLPRAVAGIFINYHAYDSSDFLARPPAAGRPSISGALEFIPDSYDPEVTDHCNGLVLCTNHYFDSSPAYHHHDYVANPATRQWAWLPPPPPPPPQMTKQGFCQTQCLVYDPAVSPHYHVFFLMIGSCSLDQHTSALVVQGYVYSSETGRWEERRFAPEVPVVETTGIALDAYTQLTNKVYRRGRLYLLCKNDLVLRISISNANYNLFRFPQDVNYGYRSSLGRSEKGIYCALLYERPHLMIFLLNESCGQVVWELKHSVDLKLHAPENYAERPDGPWILEDVKYHKFSHGNDKRREVVQDNFEWNSDDDNVLSTEDMVEWRYKRYITLLGFHPYKEVVFLNASLSRALAYHWNTSKFQDLGNICPTDYREVVAHFLGEIETSFIYTPCWMDNFPINSLEAPIED